MRERNPQTIPEQQEGLDDAILRMVPGEIIFDEEGHPIGVALPDGSLDYVSPKDEEVVVIIKPRKKLTK